MSAFKRINVSDAFVVPYTANKSWDIMSSSFDTYQLDVNIGINNTSSNFDPVNEYKTNGQYDRLVYDSVNMTYYSNFLPTSSATASRQGTIYNDGTLATSSYYNGFVNLGNLDTIKYFPTESNSIIYALNLPRQLSGDGVLPTTFEVDFISGSSTYKIYDDGNYNLFYSGSNVSSSIGTVLSQSSYVGNVFYEQNIAILTVIPNSIRLTGWRGIDPYCIQASPEATPSVTPTISVTPSVTPSISPVITPSITPTISVTTTPSITPTVTPTVTPSITKTPSITPTKTPSITPTKTPSVTPTKTPSITPSNSPTGVYTWLGRTNIDASNSTTACLTYLAARSYYANSNTLHPGITLYDDSALTIPTPGGGLYIALKLNGVGLAYVVRVNTSGQTMGAAGEC
jgi:hypothetical protein